MRKSGSASHRKGSCATSGNTGGEGIGETAEAWQPDGYEEFVKLQPPATALCLMMIPPPSHRAMKIINVGYGEIRKQAQDWIDAHKGNLLGRIWINTCSTNLQ